MTHRQLVDSAYRWLLGPAGCGFAFRELVSVNGTGEIPDVIGFKDRALHTVVIECKVSRHDFFADQKKRHRSGNPAYNPMGRYRFYATPRAMVRIDELPGRWGLLEVNKHGTLRMAHNPYNPHGGNMWSGGFDDHNRDAERAMMYSALRRLHIRGHIESIYNLADVIKKPQRASGSEAHSANGSNTSDDVRG